MAPQARVDAVVERAFTRNEEFRLGVREAFEDAINARENRPAELMAKYCDLLLKAGNKVRCARGGGCPLLA